MIPGETRTWSTKDGSKSFKLIRTHRPYNYDLADAYNAARAQHVIDGGGVWIPTPGGGVALVQTRRSCEINTEILRDRAEAERERWKYMREHPYEQGEMFDADSDL